MDWDQHRAHQLSLPARDGLARLADEISAGSRVVRVRRLGGGLGTATHAVDLRTRKNTLIPLVLKRFREETDAAALEWERLKFAQSLSVPSPEPIALDTRGDWFGGSALAMIRLTGRPLVTPRRLDRWLEQIAMTLIEIQATSIRRVPAALRSSSRQESWEPRDDLRRNELVERAIRAIQRNLPDALRSERAVAHGDFHPGNLLWTREKLTGVIDWSSARIRPRGHEASYCRADLTVLIGFDAAERFRAAYEAAWGRELGEDLWVWDLICGLNAVRWGHLWVGAYREQGRTDLTARHVWPRASSLIRNALARLGG